MVFLLCWVVMPFYVLKVEASPSTWSIETVDVNGWFPSIALDSGDRPHISYVEDLDLKYAKWTGSAWSIETLETDLASLFGDTSIAVDSSDRPHICYYNGVNRDLKYARWTGSAWSVETVDADGEVGECASIALDSNNRPHISYYDATNDDLKYARWTGSAWSIETVDADGEVGECASIALDSNNRPHISYFDTTNASAGYVKYARWTGSVWSIETVDAHGAGGYLPSMTLDSNDRPHISYCSAVIGQWNVTYARWTGSAWSIETVDVGGILAFPQIALDSGDHPHICYYDNTNYGLKYARWTGSAWSVETVDADGDVGYCNSIAVDSGNHPHISYLSSDPSGLKYARAPDEYFHSVKVKAFDSNGDGFLDAEQVDMDVDTTHSGTLNVSVHAYLRDPFDNYAALDIVTWTITSDAEEWGQALIYLPPGAHEGLYDLELFLLDGDGNYEDYTAGYDFVYLYPPDIMQLTIEVAGYGVTDPPLGSLLVPNGTVFSVYAYPDPGWMLHHWWFDELVYDPAIPFQVTMDSSHLLRAVFVEIPPGEFELFVEVAGNGTTNPSPGSHFFANGTVFSVVAFPDPGWMLDHWMLDDMDVGSSNPIEVTMDDNHVLTAVFVEIPPSMRELFVELVGNGTTDPSPGGHVYVNGTVVPVVAYSAPGWMLDHWMLDDVDVGSGNPIQVTMDKNHVLSAVFVGTPSEMRGLVIDIVGNGVTNPSAGIYFFPNGTGTSVEAFPDAGWTLHHWMLDGVDVGSNNPLPVMMDDNHVLEAVFVEIPPDMRELIIGVVGNGTTNPSPGGHVYLNGTVVLVEAFPDSGWMLDHWMLGPANVGANNPLSVTLDENKVLTAFFVESPQVSFSATIWAWDSVHGWLGEPITMDGVPTGFNTPHNFTGLTTPHTFTVPTIDAWGNPFKQWFTGETNSTITVTAHGTYTAQYYAPSSLESCNATGTRKDAFIIGETVYVTGTGYAPSKTYNLYVVADVNWTDKMAIPARIPGTATNVTSDSSGNITAAVWTPPTSLGKYDIILDGNENGQYDAEIDALDDNDVEVTAGFVIPELSVSIMLPVFAILTLLAITHAKKMPDEMQD
jgi:hypothetical protein